VLLNNLLLDVERYVRESTCTIYLNPKPRRTGHGHA